ncbi:MAG: ribonuclease Z [Clostridia bacterium]|nr:ribonuclease Z [Clostridia bacterium]
MIAIVCVDERNGMLFNNRRQTKDRVLIKHIVEKVGDCKLWINGFSSNLFKEYIGEKVDISEDFYVKAKENDYCFVEEVSLSPFEDKIDKLIIYNWNRLYPADKFLEIQLDKWYLESEKEVKGSSHEKITERIYLRGNV